MTQGQRDAEIARIESEILGLKAEIYDREVAIGHLRAVPVSEGGAATTASADRYTGLSPRAEAEAHVGRLSELGYKVSLG